MKSVAWFIAEIFDPRQPGRQTYVRSVLADDTVTLSKDSSGVFITMMHEGEMQEHWIPQGNVRQTLNVKDRAKK